jgi:hypothetical protein
MTAQKQGNPYNRLKQQPTINRPETNLSRRMMHLHMQDTAAINLTLPLENLTLKKSVNNGSNCQPT